MKKYGYDYPTAHVLAQKIYPWSEIDKEIK
jgi:hypothetical protein